MPKHTVFGIGFLGFGLGKLPTVIDPQPEVSAHCITLVGQTCFVVKDIVNVQIYADFLGVCQRVLIRQSPI